MLANLRDEAAQAFRPLGVDPETLTLAYTADVRYAGQGFELRVPFDDKVAASEGAKHVATKFHHVHTLRYGHAFADQPVEITALRLTATSPAPGVLSQWRTPPTEQAKGARAITVGGETATAEVVDRAGLSETAPTPGPVLCVEPTTTTLVPPGWVARVDDFGLLHLERENT
jgi:N-methylhydantoinase A